MEDRDKLTTQDTDALNQQPTDTQQVDETGSDKGIIGTSKETDSSEAYLAEDETGQTELAETAQGATESNAGNEDVETGVTATRDASLDDAT